MEFSLIDRKQPQFDCRLFSVAFVARQMSGIVSLLTVYNFRRDLRTEKLSLIAIDPQGSDVIRWAVWVIAVTGASSLVLPLLRRRRKILPFNEVCSPYSSVLSVVVNECAVKQLILLSANATWLYANTYTHVR